MSIQGIVFCVLGSIAMVGGGFLVLFQLTGHNAQAVQTIPVSLSSSSLTESREAISIFGDVNLSLWLKVPGRAIETKDIAFTANFLNPGGANVAVIEKEFGFFHTRTSVVGGQLYKIGEHRFPSGFVGSIHIIKRSEWNPKYDATLVVKTTDPNTNKNIFFYAGVFIVGALLVTFGVLLMNKPEQ